MDFEKGLNRPQLEAVTHVDGPLLILAGAGSGKTRVITHRIAYLIGEKGVRPWNILAITFTNKAAKEMRSRVDQMLGEEDSSHIWIMTFHACCARILRREISALGYSPNFTIYDYDDQEKLVKACIKQLNIDEKMFTPSSIQEAIGRAKDELVTPEQFMQKFGSDFRMKKVGQVYECYQAALKTANALDFDDMIMLTIKLFNEHPDVLKTYAARFKYVMVDEYQDTNTAQYVFVRLLSSGYGNLCVVGDDDQSIYGWRGANINNILDFEKDNPGCKVVKLEENYRSTGNILQAANKVIANNRSRKSKTLFTSNEAGALLVRSIAENEHEEAAYISKKIRSLIRTGGYKYSDFAVLYRVNALSRVLENKLLGEGIPYKIYGGLKFFDRREVKDVLAYIRLVYNPDDDISFQRVINVPRRGIGDVTIDKLRAMAAQHGCSMMKAASAMQESLGVTGKAADGIRGFVAIIRECEEVKGAMPLPEFITYVIEKCGVVDELKSQKNEEADERIKNVMELISIAVEFEAEESFDEDEDKLAGYLERASLDAGAGGVETQDEYVTLMTMHSAKGLEFETVFIAGMEDGIFPSIRNLTDGERMEEERRLLYVGITRAKKELYILNARTRTLYGNTTYNRQSSFIDEIPPELLTGDVTQKAKPAKQAAAATAPVNAGSAGTSIKAPVSVGAGGGGFTAPGFGRSVADVLEKTDWKKGDRLEHGKFGCGTVTEAVPEKDGYMLTIDFDGVGMKRIISSFARLKKL